MGTMTINLDKNLAEPQGQIEAQDANVYLATGELASFSSQSVYAVGYEIADSPTQAMKEQLKIKPNLKISRVASLTDLKKNVAMLVGAKSGKVPALRFG